MELWKAPLNGSAIHLAVEGSCGGTSLGIQMARQAIVDGGRVLWAAPELPDGTRFSQIFSGMELTASSRFHAMNLVGNIDCFAPGHNLNQQFIKEILKNKENYIIEDIIPENNNEKFVDLIDHNNTSQDITCVA